MKFNGDYFRDKSRARRERRETWHDWYAWHPVKVGKGDYRVFEVVQRKRAQYSGRFFYRRADIEKVDAKTLEESIRYLDALLISESTRLDADTKSGLHPG